MVDKIGSFSFFTGPHAKYAEKFYALYKDNNKNNRFNSHLYQSVDEEMKIRIQSTIEKIKTEGLIDTYQISFSDNTTFEYTISNGSADYLNITNKPSIEGVELTGNKTFKDLNIASADALTATDKNLQTLEKDNVKIINFYDELKKHDDFSNAIDV